MERLIKLLSREKKDAIAFDSTELVNDVPNAELSDESEHPVHHIKNSFRLLTQY